MPAQSGERQGLGDVHARLRVLRPSESGRCGELGIGEKLDPRQVVTFEELLRGNFEGRSDQTFQNRTIDDPGFRPSALGSTIQDQGG